VSRALQHYVQEQYSTHAPVLIMENGVSAEFRPLDRTDCRRRLGLPVSARVIGMAGAIGRARGTDVLFDAFMRLAQNDPDLYLLLAGPVIDNTLIPSHDRLIYLGQRPTAEVPHIIGAMDISVVCNNRSTFGDYCFPQKLYEIIACGVPPLVATTAGIADLLEEFTRHVYEPNSISSLISAIETLFKEPSMPGIKPVTWAQHSTKLLRFLNDVASRSSEK
jgi:glycosyltransferase involved in cell wall biosynthesis